MLAAGLAGSEGRIYGESFVNLRSGPDVSHPSKEILREGQEVRVEKEEDPQVLYSVFEDKLKVRPGLIFPDASVGLDSNGNARPANSNSGDLEYIERMSFISDLGVLLKRAARPLVKLIF